MKLRLDTIDVETFIKHFCLSTVFFLSSESAVLANSLQFYHGELSPVPSLSLNQTESLGFRNAEEIYQQSAFRNILECDLINTQEKINITGTHEYYQIVCEGYSVENLSLSQHFSFDNRISLFGRFPAHGEITLEPLDWDTFQYRPSDGQVIEKSKTLYLLDDSIIPSWKVTVQLDDRRRVIRYLNQNNEIISQRDTSFDLAYVYEKNPEDKLKQTYLSDLVTDGTLEGKIFSVFPYESPEERLSSNNGVFDFSPDSEPLEFDLVQSYYGVTRAYQWIKDHLDPNLDEDHKDLDIQIHASNKNDGENIAIYDPTGTNGEPTIYLGQGDGFTMKNMSRDTDVITHEYWHHIVYRQVKNGSGESGVLHEALADYFTFVVNDDPHIGESVTINSSYLRSGELDKKFKITSKSVHLWGKHKTSQIISSLLWEIRKERGHQFDEQVYYALDYLPHDAGYEDFFLALMQSELNLFQDKYTCDTFERALERGFVNHLKKIDRTKCDVDWQYYLDEATKNKKEIETSMPKPFNIMDSRPNACGSIGPKQDGNHLAFMILMSLPILLIFRSRKKQDAVR